MIYSHPKSLIIPQDIKRLPLCTLHDLLKRKTVFRTPAEFHFIEEKSLNASKKTTISRVSLLTAAALSVLSMMTKLARAIASMSDFRRGSNALWL